MHTCPEGGKHLAGAGAGRDLGGPGRADEWRPCWTGADIGIEAVEDIDGLPWEEDMTPEDTGEEKEEKIGVSR